MMKAYDVIKRPILTEKSYSAIPTKKYVFEVSMDANKVEIKNAVEEIFGVEVLKVNTVIVKGKEKTRGRIVGHTSDYKKAYVELTDSSKTIEFFDNLQ